MYRHFLYLKFQAATKKMFNLWEYYGVYFCIRNEKQHEKISTNIFIGVKTKRQFKFSAKTPTTNQVLNNHVLPMATNKNR